MIAAIKTQKFRLVSNLVEKGIEPTPPSEPVEALMATLAHELDGGFPVCSMFSVNGPPAVMSIVRLHRMRHEAYSP